MRPLLTPIARSRCRLAGADVPRAGAGALLAALLAVSCGPGAPEAGTAEGPSSSGAEGEATRPWARDVLDPPTARWAQAEELRADLALPRDASDGGGEASVEGEPARAGRSGRWVVTYVAGPLGVAVDGGVYFMPEPFWGWSAPQTLEREAPGFTDVSTDAEGIAIEVENLGPMLLARIAGRPLREDETVRFDYGAGPLGARADRYAERGARLWIAVDGDGDGIRAVLHASPRVEVRPGPAVRVVVHGPSVVRPGERARFTVAALDAMGNAVPDVSGRATLADLPEGWQAPEAVELRGAGMIEAPVPTDGRGVARVRARLLLADGEVLEARANPLLVHPDAPTVLWADLHGHSNYSDGTGLPEDYFLYARDVAGLDVVALTDHDHFGVVFLDQSPEMWATIRAQVAAFHDPGRFVTLLGYEWTSWIHGHRHVIYFGDEGEVHSSLDPDVETPRQLWDRLRGQNALTYAHHSAGDPVPTNWTFAPDPEIEPVTEVVSVHGSSEAADSPARIGGAVRGNFVRDALDHGYRLGFIGSGDSHDGHPGLPHLSPGYGYMLSPPSEPGGEPRERLGNGGLAAIVGAPLTRAGVRDAMRARRVYATSGPRILLAVELAGNPMGSIVPAQSLPAEVPLRLDVVGTAPIESIDLVRSGELVERLDAEGVLELLAERPLDSPLAPGEYVYVRVVQSDGGLAWSSPIFVE